MWTKWNDTLHNNQKGLALQQGHDDLHTQIVDIFDRKQGISNQLMIHNAAIYFKKDKTYSL